MLVGKLIVACLSVPILGPWLSQKNMKAVFLVLCDSPEAATFKHDPESGRLVLQPDTSPPDAAVPTVEPTTPLTPAPANEPVEGSEPPTPAGERGSDVAVVFVIGILGTGLRLIVGFLAAL